MNPNPSNQNPSTRPATQDAETKTKSTAKTPDVHESAIHFLLRHVMATGDSPSSAQAQTHLEAIHEQFPPTHTESFEDRMQKQREKDADDAAAAAKAQADKDAEELAKTDDKEKATKEKQRQALDKASEKK